MWQVLVMSIWDDHDVNMLWLDSIYPVNGTKPGDARGTRGSLCRRSLLPLAARLLLEDGLLVRERLALVPPQLARAGTHQ